IPTTPPWQAAIGSSMRWSTATAAASCKAAPTKRARSGPSAAPAAGTGFCRPSSRRDGTILDSNVAVAGYLARPLCLSARRGLGTGRRRERYRCMEEHVDPVGALAQPFIAQCRREIAAAWIHIEAAKEMLKRGRWLWRAGPSNGNYLKRKKQQCSSRLVARKRLALVCS